MKRFLLWALVVLVAAAGGVLAWLALRSPAQRPASAEKIEATPERLARGEYLVVHVADCVGCHSDFHADRFGLPIKKGTEGQGGYPVRQPPRRAGPRAGAEHHAGSGARPRRVDGRRDPAGVPRRRRPQRHRALSDDAVPVLPRDERRGRERGRRLPADSPADPQSRGAAAPRLPGEPAHQVRAEAADGSGVGPEPHGHRGVREISRDRRGLPRVPHAPRRQGTEDRRGPNFPAAG